MGLLVIKEEKVLRELNTNTPYNIASITKILTLIASLEINELIGVNQD